MDNENLMISSLEYEGIDKEEFEEEKDLENEIETKESYSALYSFYPRTKRLNLDFDDTVEYIKLAQSGDERAIDILVQDNIGLIWSSVGKFTNRGVEADDLFQIGAIGLIKCIKKFDISYDVKFSTYAVPMIIGEIKRFLRDDGIIKVSRPLKELSMKGRVVVDRLSKELGRVPTVTEVSKELDCDANDLVLALEATKGVESLYATVHQGDGQPVFLIDKVQKRNITTEDNIVDKLSLKQIISNLEPKERQIILLRYFKDKTQSDVAKIVGVSQVQVSRIEKKVLEKMAVMLG
ncbi:MAG: SigF/SigG family RNA polymerase sporulation sigma factor [Lachnospirales bacterium]